MATSMEASTLGEGQRNLRVVEFFSGVGGLHCAVKACGFPCTVVAAVEINTVANAVYQHNFPEVNLLQRNLEGFTVDDFASFDADMFVMSPPCQPFTRNGLKGDKDDSRTNAFFNIMRSLPGMPKKPTYILVENVKGFETSETRNFLVDTLEKCNYDYQEFLLSPMDIGIPNQRVRFFLLAKQHPLQFATEHGGRLLKHLVNVQSSTHKQDACMSTESGQSEVSDDSMVPSKCNTDGDSNNGLLSTVDSQSQAEEVASENLSDRTIEEQQPSDLDRTRATVSHGKSGCGSPMVGVEDGQTSMKRISGYLQSDLNEESMAEYLIRDKILLKYASMMDIVTAEGTKTCCFTKAYAHYVEGTGSILRTDLSTDMSEAFNKESCDDDERLRRLRALKLRYFTPRELANLHHFPADFSFPDCTTKKQRYRLLGNSLNVTLVAQLLHYLVT